MGRSTIILGRLLLAATILFAVARVFDPHQRWAAYDLGGDRVEHAIVVYLLVLTSVVAFPRLNVWAPAGALVFIGLSLELLQALPQVVGEAQFGDVVANALGAFAASAAIWCGRAPR